MLSRLRQALDRISLPPALAARMNFTRLRTKLTVLYMGLFGVALMLVALAVVTAVTDSARRVVRNELIASGAVYGQVWASRSDQLRQGASVLAQDYGFREAVATGDEATVRSALDNLRDRQRVEGALILGVDGYVTAAGLSLDDATIDTLWTGLDSGTVDSGVLSIAGQPYKVVAAPVLAPILIGWVVFVEPMDGAHMRQLEALSSIPLSAAVATRGQDGWQGRADIRRAIETGLAGGGLVPGTARTDQGESMVLARALPSFDTQSPAALVLTYPLSKAMKPYEAMFIWLGVIGLAGLAMLAGGTWVLARGVTEPIMALDDAVHRLQQGDHAVVAVTSADEIGRLAQSFNAMAGDIRDREARLTHMALHDQETGLPNRLALERRAAKVEDGYLILFGIERFNVVRNAIGYDSASRLIATLGARLSTLADGAPVSRISAGILGVAISAPDAETALAEAERMTAQAEAPILLDGAPIDIAVTAGVAIAAEAPVGTASPIDRAAIAVDQARGLRCKAALFDAGLYGDPGGNLSLISDLMAAMRNGEFSLAYQPKYDLREDRITGVEALARWTHPRRGFVSPDLFIGMAEETGHIRPLTEWIIKRAIADQALMSQAGHPMMISVNISGRLLSDSDFAAFALDQVTTSGAELCFEITETAVMENPEKALAIIDRFTAAGIAVSIDDYGSGLSSLAYLKQIRADELKIDKAFILSLDESARDALLVKSTIDLAHSLGLKVTAEGVETPTALALLRGMGCDIAQGYLIGRPMPLAALLEQVRTPAQSDLTAGAASKPSRARRSA
ncbi:EAL domain-containing protein [Brevundimonas vitis]|uniref:EAL domain-containing protein n=1 Tax=Brevundimonas vitisensis TaxID=2800818 RepID=A0ABX7BPE1_9CAUL|nr:EAL domain-containing protein [Brevundimonas vitisensis]QQQ19464.1 EAL domain-containing protein [Brevundimonas vitisensis]